MPVALHVRLPLFRLLLKIEYIQGPRIGLSPSSFGPALIPWLSLVRARLTSSLLQARIVLEEFRSVVALGLVFLPMKREKKRNGQCDVLAIPRNANILHR